MTRLKNAFFAALGLMVALACLGFFASFGLVIIGALALFVLLAALSAMVVKVTAPKSQPVHV